MKGDTVNFLSDPVFFIAVAILVLVFVVTALSGTLRHANDEANQRGTNNND